MAQAHGRKHGLADAAHANRPNGAAVPVEKQILC